MLKKLILCALVSTAAATAHAETAPSLETTALYTILKDDPMADLASDAVAEVLASRKAELALLFDAALTDAGKEAFLQVPPFVLGEAIVKFDAPTAAKIVALLGTDPSLTITAQGIGVESVDAQLAKFGVKTIAKLFGEIFILGFDPKINPNYVVAAFDALAETDFAEPDGIHNASGFELARHGGYPPAYVFTLGWGDCPSGCIERRRFYFETEGDVVFKVGEAGDLMSAEDRLFYFKN